MKKMKKKIVKPWPVDKDYGVFYSRSKDMAFMVGPASWESTPDDVRVWVAMEEQIGTKGVSEIFLTRGEAKQMIRALQRFVDRPFDYAAIKERAEQLDVPVGLAATSAEPKKFDAQKEMVIHCVPEDGDLGMHVHTHGLDKHGLPELEIRRVPTALWQVAGSCLNNIGDYLLNSGKKVSAGELMKADGYGLFQFQPSRDQHAKTVDNTITHCIVLELVNVLPPCQKCEEKNEEAGSPSMN